MGERKDSRIASGETFSDPTVASKEAADKKKKSKQNWRLGVLAQPRSARPKYQEPDYVFKSGVAPGALKTDCKERIEHMSRPPLRLLVVNKKAFTGLPATFADYDVRMDRRIESTWNSMYNEYKKARRDLKLKQREASAGSHRSRRSSRGKGGKGKGGKGDKKGAKGGKEKGGKGGKGKDKGDGKKSGKKADTSSIKSSEEIEKEFAEWCALRAQPKPVHEPEPLVRGPIADLGAIKERMDELATPSYPREKFVEAGVPPHLVPEAALQYEATERVIELAKPPAFRLTKVSAVQLGSVRRGALLYKTSPRMLELAVPKARANVNDADLKEDPFSINPNALKYKATARIIELAKPIER